MKEIKITSANFEAEIVNSDKPVLVDFWATWCGPCKMIGPVVAEIADECADTLKVGKINIDEEPMLASAYNVTAIPTLVLFKNGKEAERLVGLRSKAEILEVL